MTPTIDDIIIAAFELEHLQLKKDRYWRFRVLVQAPVPLMYRHLVVTLSLNETPYAERIADVELREREIKAENSLFAAEKKKELKQCEKQIEDIKKELELAKESYPSQAFEASVEEMKYTDKNFTMLTMLVGESDVHGLIEKHRSFSRYQIEIAKSNH